MFSLRFLKISHYHDVRNHLWVRCAYGLVWIAPLLYVSTAAGDLWMESIKFNTMPICWLKAKKSFNQNVLVVSTENSEMRWNIYERFYMHYMKTNKNWANSRCTSWLRFVWFTLKRLSIETLHELEWWMPVGINSLVSVFFHLV